jgi:hypothetical protein
VVVEHELRPASRNSAPITNSVSGGLAACTMSTPWRSATHRLSSSIATVA